MKQLIKLDSQKHRLVLCVPLLIAGAVSGQTVEPRELAADRPDGTESPVTVPKGMFQVEGSVWSWSRDDDAGTRVEEWSFGEVNVKYGFHDAGDVQLVLSPYVRSRETTAGSSTTVDGVGDLELRLKWNLWGNDGGDTALGLLPYVGVPSGSEVSNDHVTGGLIVPFGFELSERWSAGVQGQLAWDWDEADRDYFVGFSHTAVVGYAVTDEIGAFLEYVGDVVHGPYEASAAAGLTWRVNADLQWDVAAVTGLNEAANDFAVFQGVTFRF